MRGFIYAGAGGIQFGTYGGTDGIFISNKQFKQQNEFNIFVKLG